MTCLGRGGTCHLPRLTRSNHGLCKRCKTRLDLNATTYQTRSLTVPLEPLTRHADLSNLKRFAETYDVPNKQLHRWTNAGCLSLDWADRIAVRLGLHPILIWGDDWLTHTGTGIAAECRTPCVQ